MNQRLCPSARRAVPCAESCLEFTARLWLRTALVVWTGWLGLLGVLLART
jgi:hypothetical protein